LLLLLQQIEIIKKKTQTLLPLLTTDMLFTWYRFVSFSSVNFEKNFIKRCL
jgi:hypothetical protein